MIGFPDVHRRRNGARVVGRTSGANLSIRDLVAGYGERVILPGITLELPAGRLIGIIGPNGAGKTTLMKAILGLIPIRSGRILMGDRPMERRGGQIAYVPQSDAVNMRFPATAFDVALMGRSGRLGLLRRPGTVDRDRAEWALDQVGMLGQAGQPLNALSGGQRQRVYLARALAGEPDILLLDEPLSGVDSPTQDTIFDILERLTGQGKTVLVTTHDLRCRIERFDLLLALNRRVVAFGPPAQVFTARTLAETYGQRLVTLSDQHSAISGQPDGHTHEVFLTLDDG